LIRFVWVRFDRLDWGWWEVGFSSAETRAEVEEELGSFGTKGDEGSDEGGDGWTGVAWGCAAGDREDEACGAAAHDEAGRNSWR
jgi:hypothetical protein